MHYLLHVVVAGTVASKTVLESRACFQKNNVAQYVVVNILLIVSASNFVLLLVKVLHNCVQHIVANNTLAKWQSCKYIFLFRETQQTLKFEHTLNVMWTQAFLINILISNHCKGFQNKAWFPRIKSFYFKRSTLCIRW